MRHLSAPCGAGEIPDADASGESGSAECGDLVRISLRIRSGKITEAGFLAFGCGAATSAASAACKLLQGASLAQAACVSTEMLDADLGGLGADRVHGPEIVADAVARALEQWYSERLGDPGLPLSDRRVAVAMSGGVDSAVAALLLKQAGYEPVGVTMRLWHDPAAAAAERSCCSPKIVQMARASAHAMGIPHITLDVAERFRTRVVEDFISGYTEGRTPNPCVTCNGTVRFAILEEAAALLGARGLATGHYARVVEQDEGPAIAAAFDESKDQSYMLSMLSGALVGRLIFPLGEKEKDDVRELAHAAALPAADAVESQEICFVGETGYRDFLERNADLEPRPGPIYDADGVELGTHEGYWRYTVGQRKGLGVSAKEPLYVLRIDAERNEVWVGPRDLLATNHLRLEPAIVHGDLEPGPLEVRVRYRGRPLQGVDARVHRHDQLEVSLAEPAHGVAPGQTAALYRDGCLVAAGTIARANVLDLED